MTPTENAGTPEPTRSAPLALAGLAEIHALLLRISTEWVLELTFRRDFPEPMAELAEGDVWLLEDVEAWIKERRETVADMLKQAG